MGQDGKLDVDHKIKKQSSEYITIDKERRATSR